MDWLKKHPIFLSIVVSEGIGIILACCGIIFSVFTQESIELDGFLLWSFIIGSFFIYPILLTIINTYYLLRIKHFQTSRFFDLITFILGSIYSLLVLVFYDIEFYADWNVVLYNKQVHTPIWTKAYPTVICLIIVGLIGYFLLAYIKLRKMPPLMTVLCISAMYLGVMECILWIMQIAGIGYMILCLFPLNCIIIAIKVLRYKILEWKEIEEQEKKGFKNQFLNKCNQKLMNASCWPIAGFVLMWPLLGIIMCILLLFNQQPDYFIKSYLETGNWNLSQRVSPQNIYCDQHYLCTVAAGGHEKVVKPLRLGVRHNHEVIVNRQLCIANAFEQILEERVPRIHKHIRHFYDTYGFPIAKAIHSPWIADLIYFIMKPLEWIFLIVIYCCDVKPENRIAVQYLPKVKGETL